MATHSPQVRHIVLWIPLVCSLALSCAGEKQLATDPVTVKPKEPASTVSTPNNNPAPLRVPSNAPNDAAASVPSTEIQQDQTPPAATPPKITNSVSDECNSTIDLQEDQAIFLPENKVFITRVMSPCLNALGQKGHKRNAGWMAMGFPCSGGEGRIDWKGTNHSRPKMVSFLMETNCQMAPKDPGKLKTEAIKVLKLQETAPMIAFNPFMIQYWEVKDYSDADTSMAVDLRSTESLSAAWSHFIKGKPLKVFLVGRENAWVPGNKLYGVDGEIMFESKNRFTFKVTHAQLLTPSEREKIKTRCEALRPERACSEVF